jgi:hypothetical protein
VADGMRYYHAAHKTYQPGDDLHSYAALQKVGRDPSWKWDQVYARTDVVCLFRHVEEAKHFKRDYPDDVGPILVIDLPEWFEATRVILNEEKFPCVLDFIPGQFIHTY